MSYDAGPRHPVTGERLCHQCQDPDRPLPPSLGTKPRIYCSRNCRQRAYESRKIGQAINAAVDTAVAREAKSRDFAPNSPIGSQAKSRDNDQAKSRDFAESSQLSLEIPAPADVEPATPPAVAPEPDKPSAPPRPRSFFADWGNEVRESVATAIKASQQRDHRDEAEATDNG
ncbi:hypothetical protein [Streptomyces sp. NRRL S-118]|uniref:hypothetical protein n=1 Tax=Streptomyces sp. NRRL S-118 TaxID=1463881 RepID=UPI0004C8D972|nr:hypothetical protein [Streptomyces sp. NRRL S-118]